MFSVSSLAIGMDTRSLVPFKDIKKAFTGASGAPPRNSIRRNNINPNNFVNGLDPATLNFWSKGMTTSSKHRLRLEAQSSGLSALLDHLLSYVLIPKEILYGKHFY